MLCQVLRPDTDHIMSVVRFENLTELATHHFDRKLVLKQPPDHKFQPPDIENQGMDFDRRPSDLKIQPRDIEKEPRDIEI